MEPLKYFSELKLAIQKAPIDAINAAIKEIQIAIDDGKNVFVCGNGGSALTASHYVTDWGKMRWVNKNKQFKVFCLSDNVGMLTAYSNDVSYHDVFSEALKNYGASGDVLIVVSGSGNSENVVKALATASEMGVITIGVSGFLGGKVKEFADISVHFEVSDLQIVEDLHLSFGHIVMKQLCL